jgi:hypothetical protein
VRALSQWWDRYWFTSSTRYHYGIARIALLSGLLILELLGALGYGALRTSRGSPDAFSAPTLLTRVLHLPLPVPHWRVVLGLLTVLTVMGIVGVATRAALIGVAILTLYVGSAVSSYGFIDHATTVPTLALVVLAATPGATALSFDRWLRSRHGAARRWTGWRASWAVWPARLILVLLAVGYGSSGYAKLRETGPRWADGQTLEAYLSDPQPAQYFLAGSDHGPAATFRDGVGIESFLYSTGDPSHVGRALARWPFVVRLLSIAALTWEVTFPVVLVIHRALPWYLLGGIAFHITVWITLGLVSFVTYLFVYVVFIDWNAVARLITRSRAAIRGS